MSPSNEETQLVRARQSGLGCLKRIVQLLFLAIVAVGIFAFGYATAAAWRSWPLRTPSSKPPSLISRSTADAVCTIAAIHLYTAVDRYGYARNDGHLYACPD